MGTATRSWNYRLDRPVGSGHATAAERYTQRLAAKQGWLDVEPGAETE